MTIDLEDFIGKKAQITLRSGRLIDVFIKVSDGSIPYPFSVTNLNSSFKISYYFKDGKFCGNRESFDIIPFI